MSIESFLRIYLPGDELVHLMQQKAEQNRHSRVHAFLQEFITEGRDGLQSTGIKLKEQGIEFHRDWKTSAPIPPEEQRALLIDHAGILFGLSGIAIESAFVEQVFDANEFCGLYEESLRGTPLSSFLSPVDDGVEQLTTDRRRRMIDLAGRDRTLAVFFEPGGVDALPTALQEVLDGMEVLPVIQKHILPEYKIRAASLIAPQSLAS